MAPHAQSIRALVLVAGAQIAVLPFVGGVLSMVIALPETPDGLPALEAQLSAATLEQWIDGAQRDGEQHEIRLPKFAIEQALPLDEMLRTLGVKAAFTPGAADFSGIDGERDLFVATTEHRAILTVDEDGATAVAASGGGAVVSSLPATFIADHPFLFVIYDHVTHSILFMGRLVDPTR